MSAYAVIIIFVIAEATASIYREAVFQGAGKETLDVISSIFLPDGNETSRADDDLPYLHAAIFADNVEACEFLIEEEKVDVNAIGEDGGSALMYATAANNLELVKLLLKSGADVNYKGQDGICSLHIAARYGYVDVFKALLLESGKGVKIKIKDASQWTIYHHAAKGGHVEIIEIFSYGNCGTNQRDKNNLTPLHLAITEGHVNAALYLIEITSGYLRTSCHEELRLAARYGRKSILMALLTSGCKLEEKDENGNTVLMNAIDFPPGNVVHEHVVACAKSVEIVQMLILAGADLGAVNNAGRNAVKIALGRKNYAAYAIILKELSIAASRKYARRILPSIHFEIMEKTRNLERIRSFLPGKKDETDHLKRTALHVAVGLGYVDIVEELISAGCDLTLKDGAGNTVMFLAKSAEMARVLMKGDGNLSHILNEKGDTPLQTHIFKKREDVACALARDKKAVVTRNREGYSALDFASEIGNVVIAECLLKNGANEQILHGHSPLHQCAYKGDVEMTTFLVNNGFKTNVRDVGGSLPAHFAVRGASAGTLDTIRILMKDVERDARNMLGYSLLHSAVVSKNRDNVKMLVEEYGVPLNLSTFNGRTALLIAIRIPCADVSIDLINYGADVMLARQSGKTTLYYCMWYSGEKRLPIISPLVHAHRNLIHATVNENKTILDLIIGEMVGRSLFLPKINKYIVELELTPEDVKTHSLDNVLKLQSLSFKKFLEELTEPITFADYVERAIKELKKDNNMPENTTLEENVAGGLGNCYAFAAAYYPELASKEVQEAELEKLNSKKEEYRDAVKAYEKVKHKPFYATKLRFMLVESFMRKDGRERMLGTYMNFVPTELVDDVLIGTTNNNNVRGRMDLLANALMLTLQNKEEMRDHSDYLWSKIIRLSEVIIPK